jgi:serine/threonine protein kinase
MLTIERRGRRYASLPMSTIVSPLTSCKEFIGEAILSKYALHPCLVPLLGVSLVGGLCLVSEWQENGTITSFLSTHPEAHRPNFVSVYCNFESRPFAPINERLSFQVRHIVSGLAYLHALGFVHGDLKGVRSPGCTNA